MKIQTNVIYNECSALLREKRGFEVQEGAVCGRELELKIQNSRTFLTLGPSTALSAASGFFFLLKPPTFSRNTRNQRNNMV